MTVRQLAGGLSARRGTPSNSSSTLADASRYVRSQQAAALRSTTVTASSRRPRGQVAAADVNLVLDAGALIGIDRDDRRVAGLIELGRRAGADLMTPAPAVGQAWRDGARQARLARALAMIDVRVVDVDEAKRAGVLLGRASGADVVDALAVLLALPADQVLTSDPEGLSRLASANDVDVRVVAV